MTWTAEDVSRMAGELAAHFQAEARRWGAGGEFSRVASRRDCERAGRVYCRLLAAVGADRDDDDPEPI